MTDARLEGRAPPATIDRTGHPIDSAAALLPATKNLPQLRASPQDVVDFDLAVFVVAQRFGLTLNHAKVVASLAGLGATGAD